jgi:hypothetical protein
MIKPDIHMKDDFRQAYFEAREIIAQELKKKYNLIESYKEYDCITLDSSKFSIHLTFIVPDGDDVYISKKGYEWYEGKSYKDFLFDKYPNDDERLMATRKIFKNSTRKPNTFEKEAILFTFRMKLLFLHDFFYEKFDWNFLQ